MSEQRKDGGPAFPCNEIPVDGCIVRSEGVSMRDYFAAAALPGVMRMVGERQHEPGIDQLPTSQADFIACSAFEIANAMLKAREA